MFQTQTIKPATIYIDTSDNLSETIKSVLPAIYTGQHIFFISADGNQRLVIYSEEPSDITVELLTDRGKTTVWSTTMYDLEAVTMLLLGFNAQYTVDSIGYRM